jgi:hypothetical protein
MSTSMPDASRRTVDTPEVSQRSFGELMGEVTQDLSTLMRQELELAKAEMRSEAATAGKASGMLAGAGIAAHLVLVFLSVALWWGLSNVMDGGWAGLIVAAIWALIAAVLATVGRTQFRRVRGLPQTTETVKAIPQAVKPDEGAFR